MTQAHRFLSAGRFATGSVVVGLLEVLDAAILYAREGVIGPMSYLVGAVQLIWVVVSVYVLVRIRHRGAKLLALVYIAWVVFTYVLAALGFISTVIPMPFVFLGGAFGVVYALGAAYLGKYRE